MHGKTTLTFDIDIFRNTVEKVQFSLKSDMNNGHVT
jgi:hypothetical protein